jgi:hypothetical protein
MAICYNLWPIGIVCGHLAYLSHFGTLGPKKNLATLVGFTALQVERLQQIG